MIETKLLLTEVSTAILVLVLIGLKLLHRKRIVVVSIPGTITDEDRKAFADQIKASIKSGDPIILDGCVEIHTLTV